MKIDAAVKVLAAKGEFNVGDLLNVPIDRDYVVDYDDVIRSVENWIWDSYGISLFFGQDFDILNSVELNEELFDNED